MYNEGGSLYQSPAFFLLFLKRSFFIKLQHAMECRNDTDRAAFFEKPITPPLPEGGYKNNKSFNSFTSTLPYSPIKDEGT